MACDLGSEMAYPPGLLRLKFEVRHEPPRGKRDADHLLPLLICPGHTSRRYAAEGLALERDGKMGVHLDGSSNVVVSRLEVIEGASGLRRRTKAERARIAAESMMPGVIVADIARKHGGFVAQSN